MRRKGVAIAAIVGVCSLAAALAGAFASTRQALQVTAICRHALLRAQRNGTRFLYGKPPVALTSSLEVLRRPHSKADELPLNELPTDLASIWIEYVRLVRVNPDRTRFYLFPGVVPFPHACTRASSPSKQHSLEAEAQAEGAGSISIEMTVGRHMLGHLGYTAETIDDGSAVLLLGQLHASSSLIAGVVPDGVASVTVTSSPAAPVSAHVTTNFFSTGLPVEPHGHLRIQWLDAHEALIKTVEVTNPPHYEPTSVVVSARLIEPPPAVRRSGPHAVAEFKRGEAVLVQSGCLDCHRLAEEGNAGPGPDLTLVAERLPRRAIERVLTNPTAPMPSFRALPKGRFRALVYFLSQLRR